MEERGSSEKQAGRGGRRTQRGTAQGVRAGIDYATQPAARRRGVACLASWIRRFSRRLGAKSAAGPLVCLPLLRRRVEHHSRHAKSSEVACGNLCATRAPLRQARALTEKGCAPHSTRAHQGR
jgi:hypothetical protein